MTIWRPASNGTAIKTGQTARKHGISFDTAVRVFADPNAILRHDGDIDGEQRWQTIGSLEGGPAMLLVVHTMTDITEGAQIRIVSARKATPKERGTL